ncbi:MAG: transposase [Acidobacteria bacterium RIFCSPLOWO2_02_FULL_61_28]|nr:MAG: transposase [Acidobacteria bacterium RIFCSPLOWO2_02_FULL_61_28]
MAQTLVSILVHVIFSTKERRHLIKAEVQAALYAYMAGTMKNLDSPCLAIGGTTNHVHLLTALSKKTALSEVIGELKKSSSKWIKTKGPAYAHFAWQEGYGAFSIGLSQVEVLKRYIARQEEHHKTRSFEEELIATLKKYDVAYDERYIWG